MRDIGDPEIWKNSINFKLRYDIKMAQNGWETKKKEISEEIASLGTDKGNSVISRLGNNFKYSSTPWDDLWAYKVYGKNITCNYKNSWRGEIFKIVEILSNVSDSRHVSPSRI